MAGREQVPASSELSVPEKVDWCWHKLGSYITLHVTGLPTLGQVTNWARGEAEPPDVSHRSQRIELAYGAGLKVFSAGGPTVVKNFFHLTYHFADDMSPLEVI